IVEVPTGARRGTFALAIVPITAEAFGEPEGPIIASTLFSFISFSTALTDAVGSLASSREIYRTFSLPIFLGNKATVFFCGIPTIATGPDDDVTTPIVISACVVLAAAMTQLAINSFLKFICISIIQIILSFLVFRIYRCK